MAKNVRVFEISTTSISNLRNKEIAFESVSDSDLGWKMFGGKNTNGETTKFLGKDKALRATTIEGTISLTLATGSTVTGISNDETFADDSATILKTSSSIKTYVDTQVSGIVTDHGALTGLSDDDHTQYLLTNGSRGLSANWDAGSFKITAEQFESDIATGTPPFVVASTTAVNNFNADMVDGYHHDQSLLQAASPAFAGITLSGLTEKSIPYVGASGVITENNAALQWDDTNKKIIITSTTINPTIELIGQHTNYYSPMIVCYTGVTPAEKVRFGVHAWDGHFKIYKGNYTLHSWLNVRTDNGFVGVGVIPDKLFQVGASATNVSAGFITYSITTGHTNYFDFAKSRSNSKGTITQTINNDIFGVINFVGVTSENALRTGAYIRGIQNGASTATDIPTDIGIFTSDGTAAAAVCVLFDKNGNSNIGDGGVTNYTKINKTGDQTFHGSAGLYPRVLNQSAQPAAGTGATQLDTGEMCLFTDTDDSKCYVCYNHGGTVKSIELT